MSNEYRSMMMMYDTVSIQIFLKTLLYVLSITVFWSIDLVHLLLAISYSLLASGIRISTTSNRFMLPPPTCVSDREDDDHHDEDNKKDDEHDVDNDNYDNGVNW